jgi:uncharacterized membrane protein
MPYDRNPAHWKFLFFYYNPDDSRLVVPKRWTGNFATLNFARPAVWIVLIVFLVTLIVAIPFASQINDFLKGR